MWDNDEITVRSRLVFFMKCIAFTTVAFVGLAVFAVAMEIFARLESWYAIIGMAATFIVTVALIMLFVFWDRPCV